MKYKCQNISMGRVEIFGVILEPGEVSSIECVPQTTLGGAIRYTLADEPTKKAVVKAEPKVEYQVEPEKQVEKKKKSF